jgi:hypothetical protein
MLAGFSNKLGSAFSTKRTTFAATTKPNAGMVADKDNKNPYIVVFY